jgi:hypothetical protein
MRFALNFAVEFNGGPSRSRSRVFPSLSPGSNSSSIRKNITGFAAYRLFTLVAALGLSVLILIRSQMLNRYGYGYGGAGQMLWVSTVISLIIGVTSSGYVPFERSAVWWFLSAMNRITAAFHQSSGSVELELLTTIVLSGGCLALGILRTIWEGRVWGLGIMFFSLFALGELRFHPLAEHMILKRVPSGATYGVALIFKMAQRHMQGKEPWVRVNELDQSEIRLPDLEDDSPLGAEDAGTAQSAQPGESP